jgi:hypothetical protein
MLLLKKRRRRSLGSQPSSKKRILLAETDENRKDLERSTHTYTYPFLPSLFCRASKEVFFRDEFILDPGGLL